MEEEVPMVLQERAYTSQSGTSLQELKELGGWSCFEMVLRYAHLRGDHLKEAANRISVTNRSQSDGSPILKIAVSN